MRIETVDFSDIPNRFLCFYTYEAWNARRVEKARAMPRAPDEYKNNIGVELRKVLVVADVCNIALDYLDPVPWKLEVEKFRPTCWIDMSHYKGAPRLGADTFLVYSKKHGLSCVRDWGWHVHGRDYHHATVRGYSPHTDLPLKVTFLQK